MAIRSAYLNPQLFPFERPHNVPGSANHLAWWAVAAASGRLAGSAVNQVRVHYGLTPLRNAMGAGDHSRILTAVIVSAAFLPPPPDWPDYAQVVGYCFWVTP